MTTFAVAFIRMVTGAGPQSKVMIPPAATAFTTASEVQLAGVPVPTVRVGREVSTARASAGTAACPSGLPARNATVDGVALGLALPRPARALGSPVGGGVGPAAVPVAATGAGEPGGWSPPQAGRVAVATPRTRRTTADFTRTGRC
ncbi:hypothetical protein Nm8I071_00810 [Nonomuraea sp. TT08I-71]|nr:hypothetical protein Nm8I071_00810 [Nonomuraea sp. TT08I-71]